MPDFHDRRSGSLIRLTVDHPDIEPTYHPNLESAHKAAGMQAKTYKAEGAKYSVHEDGKQVWSGNTDHPGKAFGKPSGNSLGYQK
jgi:hypothetical protein